MASKILENDLLNKGVLGMADKPGLSAKDMQYKFEEIQREIIIPKLNEVIGEVGSMLSPFDNEKTYAVGEYCIYKDELYKCIDAVTIPGTWNDKKWGGTTLSDALKDLQSQVDNAIKESANAVAEEAAARKAEIAIERARIDSIAKLPEGSTTGDAELIDGRVDYKGNTHTNIGEHIREVSSQLSSDLASYGYPTLSVIWNDGYLKADGTIESESTYQTSELIHIPSGYRLVFNSYASTSTYHYCNYTSDGTFETVGFGHTGLLGRNGIKIDAIEDRYVKICNKKTQITNVDAHFEKLESCPTSIADISNILPLDGVTFVKGYLSASTHERVDSEVYHCSSQIFIQRGQTIEFKCSGSTGALLIMEITRDFSYVASLFQGDGEYHRLRYTADHDMWIRICTRTEKGGNYVPLEEFKASIKFYYKSLYYANEKLNGKKFVIIGDSLIKGNKLGTEVTWTKILANDTNADVFNYGINGNAISAVSGATGEPMSVRYADIAELPTADIIVVEGGANDKNLNCPIGTISDVTNDTFMGACNVLIDGIRALNPTANLLFMTTYHRYQNKNTLGFAEVDYADAMLNVCRDKAVSCFDNCINSGLTFLDSNLSAWCDEGLYIESAVNKHFSPQGYEFIYPKYKHWIESQI